LLRLTQGGLFVHAATHWLAALVIGWPTLLWAQNPAQAPSSTTREMSPPSLPAPANLAPVVCRLMPTAPGGGSASAPTGSLQFLITCVAAPAGPAGARQPPNIPASPPLTFVALPAPAAAGTVVTNTVGSAAPAPPTSAAKPADESAKNPLPAELLRWSLVLIALFAVVSVLAFMLVALRARHPNGVRVANHWGGFGGGCGGWTLSSGAVTLVIGVVTSLASVALLNSLLDPSLRWPGPVQDKKPETAPAPVPAAPQASPPSAASR
jgi:hypothetical protein